MTVVSVIFYDKENGQFYHAIKPYKAKTKSIREWLDYHIKNYDIQAYLSYKHKGENYKNEGFYDSCICLDLLEEMHKQDFYLCNFENFDYMVDEYDL